MIFPRTPPDSDDPIRSSFSFENGEEFEPADFDGEAVDGADSLSDDTRIYPEIEGADLLADLRNLIVTEESHNIRQIIEVLDYLRAKLDDPDGLVRTLKPVIGEVLSERITDAPAEMERVLGPLVVRALYREARDHPRELGIAMAPVVTRGFLHALGGRILHSIGAAVRTIGEITWFPFRKRLRGALAAKERLPGRVPSSDPQAFAVQECFLIGRENGLLLAYGTWDPKQASARVDSRFLPSLRRFLKTELEAENEENENTLRARFEEDLVIIEVGELAHLVCIVSGVTPTGFEPDMRQALTDIHERYSRELKCARNGPGELVGIRPFLRVFLDRYRPEDAPISDGSNSNGLSEYDPIRFPGPAKKSFL